MKFDRWMALPTQHIYHKPKATRAAARIYEYDFDYRSQPTWSAHASLLNCAQTIRRDRVDWRLRDMVDIQSFIWALGSDEYTE